MTVITTISGFCLVLASISDFYAKSEETLVNDYVNSQINMTMDDIVHSELLGIRLSNYSRLNLAYDIYDSKENIVASGSSENQVFIQGITQTITKVYEVSKSHIEIDDEGVESYYSNEIIDRPDVSIDSVNNSALEKYRSNSEFYVLEIYFNPDITQRSFLAPTIKLIHYLYLFRYYGIAIVAVAFIIAFITFILLMKSVGNNDSAIENPVASYSAPPQAKPSISFPARIPFELPLAAVGSGVIAIAYFLFEIWDFFEMQGNILAFMLFMTLSTTLGVALTLCLCVILAIQLKGHTLIRSSLCSKLVRVIHKVLHRIKRILTESISLINLYWKIALLVGVLTFCEFFGILISNSETDSLLIMWFIEKLIILFILYRVTFSFNQIKKGTQALAGGNTDYKVDTVPLRFDFKECADNLNNISSGMSQAIQSKMRSELLKTELITNVSHDIKTPLTSIINYVGLITKEVDNLTADNNSANSNSTNTDVIKEYSEVLITQSDKLKKLIEDLVEASRAGTGNIEVNLAECDATMFISQVSGEYEDKLAASELTLVTDCSPESVMINADPRRMWRIFDNLMNNICKYSLRGSRVYLTLKAIDENAVITFKNTSAQELNISSEELLERFVRGDKSRNSLTEGNGLGLSIAQSLTELQHGTLKLDIDGDLFKATLIFPITK
ncbi:MAG: sensor histidine kinase [Clostridia bacterium]|nr:sensor histidine kinase [Clostridia bacterium]